jgi:hypothetical protein
MRITELTNHLRQIHAAYGDIDVRVDSDLFSDHQPRDVTSVTVLEFFVRDIQQIIIGQFPSEPSQTKVVLYVGNEPKLKL